MQSVFFSAAQRKHRLAQLQHLNRLKKAEIILCITTLIQIIIQIIDVIYSNNKIQYEYYYAAIDGIKGRDSEYPHVNLFLRITLSAICAIQIISVIYIYQKSFEMSIEMSARTKRKYT